MPKSGNRIAIQKFSISDEQLEELVIELNEAFDDRRCEISLKRNVDPFERYPVLKEKFYLPAPGINERNGNIYIDNIVVSRDEIKLHIDVNMTIIKSLLKSSDRIERLAKQQHDIKRMGAGEFSVGILRDAMSSNWSHKESGGSPLLRPTLLKIAEAMPAKGPGRPPAGQEPGRLRATDPVDVEDCTPTEVQAMTLEEYQVDDAPLLTCRLPGTDGVGL